MLKLRNAAILALVVAARPSVAQVPDGHYVVSSFSYYDGQLVTLNGGLCIVDPRVPGTPIPINGLPADLTTPCVVRRLVGASCVEIRPSDETLFVGEVTDPFCGGTTDLHVITLYGFAVATHYRIPMPSSATSIDDLAVLPDGDVLVVGDLGAGILARVRPSAGTVTMIPMTPVPAGYPIALAVEPTGTSVYFAMIVGPTQQAHIYSLPVTGGIPQLLVSSGFVTALAVHPDGRIYYPSVDAQYQTWLYWVEPATGQVGTVSQISPPGGLAIEQATGNFVLAGSLTNSGYVELLTPSGVRTPLTSAVSSWPGDVDVAHNPRTYGTGTPAQNRYSWQTAPNPGGLPRIGNANFRLQLDASPSGNASGVLLASPSSGSVSIVGVELLLGAAGLLHVGSVPSNGRVQLPIPSNSALVGTSVFFQSFHFDPGGLAASDGVRLTVMR